MVCLRFELSTEYTSIVLPLHQSALLYHLVHQLCLTHVGIASVWQSLRFWAPSRVCGYCCDNVCNTTFRSQCCLVALPEGRNFENAMSCVTPMTWPSFRVSRKPVNSFQSCCTHTPTDSTLSVTASCCNSSIPETLPWQEWVDCERKQLLCESSVAAWDLNRKKNCWRMESLSGEWNRCLALYCIDIVGEWNHHWAIYCTDKAGKWISRFAIYCMDSVGEWNHRWQHTASTGQASYHIVRHYTAWTVLANEIVVGTSQLSHR